MAKMIWRPRNSENVNDGQSVVEGEQRNVVATDIAGKDDKLEVKTSGAWYAAELTFRKDGTTRVHFDDYASDDDEEWDAEKVRSLVPISEHIRVVSEQLQDEECSIMSVNKIVCALRRTEDADGWYDAIVTEMRKKPHTIGNEGEICNCLYTVTWRDGPGKGLTQKDLTCGDICVPSTKDVETHPLVRDILRHANCEGRGINQKKGPSCSAPGVRRKRGDTDYDTESSEEQVYVRRKKLEPKVTNVCQAKDPLQQSELVVDDQNAGTASTENEDRDVSSLSFRSAELIKEMSLSGRSSELIREMTAEMNAGVDHLKQSVEAEQSQDVLPLSALSSLSAAGCCLPKKKMRGQVENESSFPSDIGHLRDRIFGTKSSERFCKNEEQRRKVSPDVNSFNKVEESQTEQQTTSSPIQEHKTQASTDLREEAKCEVPVKREVVESRVELPGECHVSCSSSEIQVKNEDVKRKADVLEDIKLSSMSPVISQNESGGKGGFSKLRIHMDIKEMETKVDPILKQTRADVLGVTVDSKMAKTEAYVTPRKTEIASAKSEVQRSKKVRITVEFDIGGDESASILDGVSLSRSFPAGAKVTSSLTNNEGLLDSDGKSETMSTTGKAYEPIAEPALSDLTDRRPLEAEDEKLVRPSVEGKKGWHERQKEELPQSVDESVGASKKINRSVQPKIEDGPKVVIHSFPGQRSGNEQELVDSKSRPRLGSAANNAICLSDEEEEADVRAGSSIPPTSSTRRFLNSRSGPGSDHAGTTEHRQEGRNSHPQNNQARNRRSAFIKNLFARPGCILMIDNLEIGVRESEVREQLLKFFNKEKIQSVTIPPPHPELNHATGYVNFADTEAADMAARVLTSCAIVSSSGRPWVVGNQGQEGPSFLRTSDLMGHAQDGTVLSSGTFKVLTARHSSEYNAARNRLRVFEEYRKQTRVMLQRHAQEDKNLDDDPDVVLYC